MRVSCEINNLHELQDESAAGILRKKIFTSDGGG